jgi:Domain of unknown function (DUF4194)
MTTAIDLDQSVATTPPPPDLSAALVHLLKGVIYRDSDERLWSAVVDLQARIRDYVTVLGLDLLLDPAEGYAFLKSRSPSGTESDVRLPPRLVARRPLSFPVSLLVALLRKKLAEFDSGAERDGDGRRLVLTRDDIVELLRVFMPDSTNEARLINLIDAHINKVTELGFLRKLKSSSGPRSFEVRRIIKAFVDAQWLSEFDERLAAYQTALTEGSGEVSDHE